jgi:hypothetical protein
MDKILEERENNEEQNETAIMMIVQLEIVVVIIIIMIAMDKMIIPVVKAMTVVEITTRRQIGPFQLFYTKISIFFIFYFFLVL